MSLIIEHCFPLGRFHATRWKQNPYEDPYGEWPPSPWRLLRALAARWFQYVREAGDNNEQIRDSVLTKLAASLPKFVLPPFSFKGFPIVQYQPTEVTWTDGSSSKPAYKKPKTTKAEDHYRALPCDEPLFWVWDDLDLTLSETTLLDNMLKRMLFFGRAESFSRLRRVSKLPIGIMTNCNISERGTEAMPPVLAPIPGNKLDIKTLLAFTDDKKQLKGRPMPSGTAWFYALLPERPSISMNTASQFNYPRGLNCIQFAVSGRVYPPLSRWIKITERFRGAVIRCLASNISPESGGRYDRLSLEDKNTITLITGKDGQGKPLHGHRHAFFIICPDADGLPSRLIVWRTESFIGHEIDSMLRASERPLTWDNHSTNWKLGLIPLPFETPVPAGLLSESKTWVSATPFVPPANRHRFRKNGRMRSGESIECIALSLLKKQFNCEPTTITALNDAQSQSWLNLHITRERRFIKENNQTPFIRPGFKLRLEFSSPVQGPIIIGDSSHFGLGLFVPGD